MHQKLHGLDAKHFYMGLGHDTANLDLVATPTPPSTATSNVTHGVVEGVLVLVAVDRIFYLRQCSSSNASSASKLNLSSRPDNAFLSDPSPSNNAMLIIARPFRTQTTS